MNNNINGATLRKMISGAAGLLEQNKEQVDKLNVFPVPDGDTGTNMALTMQSVVKEVSLCNNNNIPDLCTAIATGALRGARGNSGVILSQIIKGLAITWSMSGKIDPKTTAKAIEHGAKIAYEAVTKPQEGTILTVIKDMAKSAKKLSRKKDIDMDDFLKGVLDAGVVSLKSTPEFLPILKEAGVVDSGGQGLLFVFQGFYNVILGREDGIIDFDINFGLNVDLNQMFHANYNSLADIEYSYCTEFFCINLQKKTTESNISRFREYLTTIGDCVLVIGDLSLIKVHVHTNDPGLALSYALSLGEISGIKIENMLEQNRVIAKENTKQKEMGVVAVCSGFGLVSIFKEMLVDAIVEGGQSMNP
ncbi:MAG: DAK2 domain-containing protein, partial [Firmicutes bacterium]|nr:DAK2 domain-containing protein [Bacillota bacterium]